MTRLGRAQEGTKKMQLADYKELNKMTLEEARAWLKAARYVRGEDVNGVEIWNLLYIGEKMPLHCVGATPDGVWHDYANGLCEDGCDLVEFCMWDMDDFGIVNPFTCIKIWPRGEYEYIVNGHVYVWDGVKINDFGEAEKANIQEAFEWIQDNRYEAV